MAEDNHIRFSLSSVFNGEGFQKARQAVTSVNNQVKSAAGAANGMAGALDGLDAAGSKAFQAMSGLVQSLATFNVAAIASQAVMTGINMYVSRMKEETDAYAASVEKMRQAVEAGFGRAMTNTMRELSEEIKTIKGGFEGIVSRANAFAAAVNGVKSAQAAGGVARLEVEKLQAMIDAHSDAERAAVEAEYNLQIATEKAASSRAQSEEKVKQALGNRADADQRVTNIELEIIAVQKKRAELEDVLAVAKASKDEHAIKIQEQINQLRDREESLTESRLDAENKLKIADVEVEKARILAANADTESAAAVARATLAEKRVEEAATAKAEAESKAAAAAAEKSKKEAEAKAAADKKREADEKAAALQEAANESVQSLKTAQDEFAQALKAYQDNYLQNAVHEATKDLQNGNGRKTRSGAMPVEVMNALQARVSDQAVADAINRGLVTSVKDADRLAREAARQARDAANRNSGQRAREAKRYERLMERPKKDWSKADADFVKKFKAIQEAADKQKKDLEEKARRLQEEQQRAKKNAEELAKVAKNTGKLENVEKKLAEAIKKVDDAMRL